MFKQISAIQNRFQDNAYNITDDELIASAMAAAPDQYHSIITSTQITKGNALTLQDVENAMTQYWRVHVGVKETHNKNSSDKEVIISAVNGGRGRGGRGNYSGRGGRGGRGKGPCWICKGPRMKRDCWELEANASKRPKNWQSKLTSAERE